MQSRTNLSAAADLCKLNRTVHPRNGHRAGIVFDPVKYVARSPHLDRQPPAMGVAATIVNGQIAIDNGKMTAVLSGRPLAHVPTRGSCL